MVLPLNLAMTLSEIAATQSLPAGFAWMSCHFCPDTEGITNIPEKLPECSMLILTDRESCNGHNPDLVAQQLLEAVQQLHCESVLLDFQRPWDAEANAIVKAIVDALPYPTAVTETFAGDLSCPVFLSPCPLHVSLATRLRFWEGREIWLEAALCQESITVTTDGATFTPIFPTQQLTGGLYDKKLHCRYHTSIAADRITFTLFDTHETLAAKLELAHSLGVTRAVGLYQELGRYFHKV